jgi:hypothetical protein
MWIVERVGSVVVLSIQSLAFLLDVFARRMLENAIYQKRLGSNREFDDKQV